MTIGIKDRSLKTVVMATMLATILAPVLVLGAGPTLFSAQAQSFSEMAKPEVPAEVNNFPLDEKFLIKMEAAQAELNEMDMSGESQDETGTGDHSPKALAARIEKQPKVKAALAEHGLTPQEYIYGYFALVSSVSAVEAESEEQIVDELKGINPAHLAFGKKYIDRIHKLLGE